MMKIQKLIVLIFCIMVTLPIYAQMGMRPGWKIDFGIESAPKQNLEMNTSNSDALENGNVRKNMKVLLDISKTFAINKKLTLGLSSGYRYYNFDFDFGMPLLMDMDDHHHAIRFGGNAIYNTLLWSKPLVLMSNVTVEGGKWGMEWISGIGVAMLILKASREEILGIGLIGLFNRTSDIPVFPMIIYRKVFSSRWILNLNHPFFSMQYICNEKHTVMAGFAFENERFWLKPAIEDMPEITLFNRSIMRSGINYDYKFCKGMTLTLQSGWEYSMRTRMFNRNGGRKLMDFGHPDGLYARMSVSYRIGKNK